MKKNHFNCVYMYVNVINKKRYIGQAKDFNKRHKSHIRKSTNKFPIDRAFNKYGEDKFEIIILKENLESQCLLNFWECYFIDKYNTLMVNNCGYNLASGGHNGNAFAGKTEEEMKKIREKISNANKGGTWDISGENNPMYGKFGKNNPNYGKHLADETKKKMSESKKGKYKGENNPMYGIHRYGLKSPGLGKLICRCTKDGELLDVKYQFQYVEMGFSASYISICCKYHEMNCNKEEWFKKYKCYPRKTVNGFVFKYYVEKKKSS